MRCNDCTQHVLDGPLSVCTLVELCCAHVVYASAWVVWPFWFSNSSKCHFTPKWLLTLFQCCHVFSSSSPTDIIVICLSPTMNKSTSVMKCLLLGSLWMLNWNYTHLHTYNLSICGSLIAFSNLLFAVEPPSGLKFKILNENTVEMSWTRPSSRIEGFRIQVVSDAGEFEAGT